MDSRVTLRLYLDDCADDSELREVLRSTPYLHEVVTPAEAGLLGADDDLHFAFAVEHDLILITKHPADFIQLHGTSPDHPGIFLIYQDNRPADMQPADIARAIQNLVDAGVPLRGTVHELNRWRFQAPPSH
jgi:hypothetical protein